MGVWYADYGNTETVTLERLYLLPEEVADMDMQAIHCRLSNIVPCGEGGGDWTHEVSDRFHAMLDSAEQVTVSVEGEGQPHPVTVDLAHKGNVSRLLVQEGGARWLVEDPSSSTATSSARATPPGDSPFSGASSPLHDVSAATQPEPLPPPTPQQAAVPSPTLPTPDDQLSSAALPDSTPCEATHPSIPPPPLPAVGATFSCVVSHVISREQFYVIPTRSRCEEIATALASVKSSGVKSIKVGEVALANYDGFLYRVVYEGKDPWHGYKVFYVDSGIRGVVRTLVAMPADLGTIPMQAFPCSLQESSHVSVSDYQQMATALVQVRKYSLEPPDKGPSKIRTTTVQRTTNNI